MELTRQQKYDAKRYAENPNYRREKNAAQRKRLGDDEFKRRTNAYKRKSKTGATPEWVEQQRVVQGGCCAICRVLLTDTVNGLDQECVDHCHVTKTPRALLCRACNISIGMYENAQRAAGLRIEPFEAYLG